MSKWCGRKTLPWYRGIICGLPSRSHPRGRKKEARTIPQRLQWDAKYQVVRAKTIYASCSFGQLPDIFLLKTMYGKLSACVAFAMAVKNRSPVQGTTVGCNWVGPISHPKPPSVRSPKRMKLISESSRFKHRSSSYSYRYIPIFPFPFPLHYYRILLWEIRTRK